MGLDGRVVAILAGLRLLLVGDELLSGSADLVSIGSLLISGLRFDPNSDDLQESGDPLELGLDSSFKVETGFASTGGAGALALTLVPVSLAAEG